MTVLRGWPWAVCQSYTLAAAAAAAAAVYLVRTATAAATVLAHPLFWHVNVPTQDKNTCIIIEGDHWTTARNRAVYL